MDRPSVPHHQPTATPAQVLVRIEAMRRAAAYLAQVNLPGKGFTRS
jgi:hypothetical protein